ncbi:MAG: NAD-dependent epimerase/dehydratase family protein, partial [Aliifodinibius sp.]|nr:NAD-dependent epimerase/dehydratase family protein [Fodinibius sp.]NIV13862.1 NAD-dependent epimerase/dehydratase family protein [Fodinibius sp.]NIY27617.1 NAD-dependent epimerase/dehydratase family protein [Fodinibius sp.]
PGTPYGWEKLFTEIMCKCFEEDYGLKTRITRYHNIYGPKGTYKGGREKAPAALCRKVAMAKDGESITIWGNGKQIRSFLYIDDCL